MRVFVYVYIFSRILADVDLLSYLIKTRRAFISNRMRAEIIEHSLWYDMKICLLSTWGMVKIYSITTRKKATFSRAHRATVNNKSFFFFFSIYSIRLSTSCFRCLRQLAFIVLRFPIAEGCLLLYIAPYNININNNNKLCCVYCNILLNTWSKSVAFCTVVSGSSTSNMSALRAGA